MPSEKQPAPGVGNAVQAATDVGRARGHSQCPARRGRWGTVWATPLDFCYASVRNEPGERGWPCQMAVLAIWDIRSKKRVSIIAPLVPFLPSTYQTDGEKVSGLTV